MNNKWLLFSFTLPAKSQAGRMRVWRRLTGLGAVIVKSALYALPAREDLREQLSWLTREVEDMGGEALLLETGPPANISGGELATLFSQARDAAWQGVEDELLSLTDKARAQEPDQGEIEAARRKLLRQIESLHGIDYFPSGKGGRVDELASELDILLSGRDGDTRHGVAPGDASDFKGKTWVTRQNPYIDRLASFWLVRRFIDSEAAIEFVPAGDRPGPRDGYVRFDMDDAEFTHAGPLTTFEVLCVTFSLGSSVPARFREVIRAIDLEGIESGPPETPGVKRVLDGLCLTSVDDHARVEAALVLFDALLTTYTHTDGEK